MSDEKHEIFVPFCPRVWLLCLHTQREVNREGGRERGKEGEWEKRREEWKD